MFFQWLDLFSFYSFAQIATISAFLVGLHIYAYIVRGRTHFLTELVVYITAFIAFLALQDSAEYIPTETLRIVGSLSLALWVHVLVLIRSIVRRLLDLENDS